LLTTPGRKRGRHMCWCMNKVDPGAARPLFDVRSNDGSIETATCPSFAG